MAWNVLSIRITGRGEAVLDVSPLSKHLNVITVEVISVYRASTGPSLLATVDSQAQDRLGPSRFSDCSCISKAERILCRKEVLNFGTLLIISPFVIVTLRLSPTLKI